jgi:3-hydroxyacyl-[acyl-carrier-protein] dehydratase
LDRVIECEPGVRLLGLKNVTYNEPFFQGHFPHLPIMPGVLILEALAQATGLLASETDPNLGKGMTYYWSGLIMPALNALLCREISSCWRQNS